MRGGGWLVLCAYALSLVHADRDIPMTPDRVTPMPADPELNAKWLEDFRRELLKDAYDDETSPKPSSRLAYRTHAPKTTSDSTLRHHASDKVPLPARRALGAVSTRRTIGRTPGRHPSVGHSSGEPGPPLDESLRHRTDSATVAVGHMPDRLPPDTPGGPLVGRLSGMSPARRSRDDASVGDVSGRPPERRSPDDVSVGHVSGRPSGRSPDDAASRELGISRRDLYGGRGHGSMTDQELDAKRQPFLKSLHELDNQMMPVIIPHDANSDNQLRRARKSRKGLWHANSEQIQDKPSYIIDHNGIKRYRVHTDPRERFRNQFGGDEPGLKEEWGFNEFDEMRGLGEDRYQERLREDRYKERLSEDRYQERGHESLSQKDDRYQESRDESSSRDEGVSISDSHELNVSEYQQEDVRSRYIQKERPEREYGQRFSARRDAALLADGLASSSKPCDCMTEHPQIIPEL